MPDPAVTPFPPSAAVAEPPIILTWLLRLRWLAIAGQVSATLVAFSIGLRPRLSPVLFVVLLTAASNLLLWRLTRTQSRRVPPPLIFSVLLLDIVLLTLLLRFTGGHENPFSTLYLVHVAMSVTMLGAGWMWAVLAAATLAYLSLFFGEPEPLFVNGYVSSPMRDAGLVTNFVLIGGLIAYFSGRISRALKQSGEEVRELQERNARHEKLATLSTLAAGAAHELGTPLATIKLVAKELELAIAKLPESDALVEDAQLIRQETDRCRFILDRMRVEVASDPAADPTPLSELMTRLAEHLREDERQILQITGDTGGERIATPCPAITQSLTVMIRNAIDASPAGSPIKLVVRRLPKPPGAQSGATGTIAFDVIDQGHGMSEETVRRAGEPFYTTKEAGRGMGLGLFLVRLVAENYRGKFSLSSKAGQGTKSTLELPLA
jgi:two-component system sensor histidine kinase RegB